MKIISIKKALTLVQKSKKNKNIKVVEQILNQVEKNGDSALFRFEKKFKIGRAHV